MKIQHLHFNLFIALLLGTHGLSAQSDARATALLDDVYNNIQSYKDLQMEFKYVLENKEADLYEESKGNMTVKGDLYKVDLLGAQQLFDGKKVYTITPDNQEVIVQTADDSEGFVTPSRMLTFYREGHTANWDILQDIQGRKIQYIKLTSGNSGTDLKYILLGVDVATKNVYRIIEVGNDNTKTTITVQSLKADQNLSDNYFAFDREKYLKEGYYIDE